MAVPGREEERPPSPPPTTTTSSPHVPRVGADSSTSAFAARRRTRGGEHLSSAGALGAGQAVRWSGGHRGGRALHDRAGGVVAARNALAKALKADGHRDEAAAVAALRRPTVPDWALNSVALQEPDVVADAVDAAEHLRSVQAATLGDASAAPDLRDAMAQARQAAVALRKAAEDVLRRAGRPAGDMSALTTRLNETMVHPGLLSQLQAGRLGTAAVDVVDPFSGAPVGPSTLSTAPARSGRVVRGRAAPRPPPPGSVRPPSRPRRRSSASTSAPSARRGGRPRRWSDAGRRPPSDSHRPTPSWPRPRLPCTTPRRR